MNLVEYALGLGPKVATTATEWIYTYTLPVERSDISYTVEISSDLVTWSASGVMLTWISTTGGVETWRATHPLASAANLFFRLKVQQN